MKILGGVWHDGYETTNAPSSPMSEVPYSKELSCDDYAVHSILRIESMAWTIHTHLLRRLLPPPAAWTAQRAMNLSTLLPTPFCFTSTRLHTRRQLLGNGSGSGTSAGSMGPTAVAYIMAFP